MDHLFGKADFWVAVAFLIFVALILRLGFGRIVGTLDSRAERIRRELDEAAKLRQEAQDLLARYQRQQREAEQEAAAIVAHAEAEAKRMAEDARREIEATLKRRTDLTLERIAQAEATALAQVRGEAIDIAMRATEKLLAESVDEARGRTLVDDAIAELGRKLH